MKTGIVDVGGGMRGIYAAGVLDTCMEQGVTFDLCIGVSAGSANMASYLAGQRGRNYRFYHEYSFRREYMGTKQYLRTGSYINLPYIYGTLSNGDGEDPLDYDVLQASPARFLTVATDAETGKPHYFTEEDLSRDDYRIFMASSCVPGVDKPVCIDGTPYFDGALSDPVPIRKALEEGCDRVVLLLSKPLETRRTPGKDRTIAEMIRRKYPNAAEGMRQRAERYNRCVDCAKTLVTEGRVLILAPESIEGVDTLKRDKDALDRLYRMGLQDGEGVSRWLKNSTPGA